LQLPAGAPTSSLIVGIDTSTAGAKSGTATLALVSDGTGTSGLGNTPLPSQTVNVTANVFRLAASAHAPEPVAFGNHHVGDTLTQPITVSNLAGNDGFSEKLNASIGGTTGTVTASGSFNLLAPGATDNTSLIVNLTTTAAGANAGTVTINFVSDGTGTSGLGQTPLASQTVNISGSVFRLASPSNHSPEPVNFGNKHVGDVAEQAITISRRPRSRNKGRQVMGSDLV
jgi:hypothetical protein